MARRFVIKAAKGKKKSIIDLAEPSEFLYFYATSLNDLWRTLRCLTARCYRIPKPPTLSKRINNGRLTMENPLFKTLMYDVIEIKVTMGVIKEMEYENSFGFKHNIKLVHSQLTENIFKNHDTV